mmetsp:Transcript_38175/g.62618  ORF Transcript_38175/g.62618 Transcript_38175/m.62618 type:complete len:85 (-) Transcript_38175:68-322(-)
MHSRHTTATSLTGTFAQPEYPNIVTAVDDEEHHKILASKNLMEVPLNRQVHHLSSEQKHVVQIFDQKTTVNISTDNDPTAELAH